MINTSSLIQTTLITVMALCFSTATLQAQSVDESEKNNQSSTNEIELETTVVNISSTYASEVIMDRGKKYLSLTLTKSPTSQLAINEESEENNATPEDIMPLVIKAIENGENLILENSALRIK